MVRRSWSRFADTGRADSFLGSLAWLSIGSIAVKPLWFLFITAFCMRILTPEQYGVLSVAMALMIVILSFSDLGLTHYSIREISAKREKAQALFVNFLSLRLAAAVCILVAAIVVLSSIQYMPGWTMPLLLAGCYGAAIGIIEFCRSVFRSFDVIRLEAFFVVAEKVLVVGLGALLLLHIRTADGALLGMALAALATLILITWSIHRFLFPLKKSLFDLQLIKQSLRKSLPLGVFGIITVMYIRTNLILVEVFLTAEDAGFYGSAFRILEAMILLPALVAAPLLPRLSRYAASFDLPKFSKTFSSVTIALVAAGVLIGFGISAFSAPIYGLLDPQGHYATAIPVLAILAWVFPFSCLNHMLHMALIALDKRRFLVILVLGVALVNFALCPFMLVNFGVHGGAIAMIATDGLLALCGLAGYLRFRKEFSRQVI